MRGSVRNISKHELFALVLMTFLLLISIWQAKKIEVYRSQPYIYKDDIASTNSAIKLWSRKTGVDELTAMKNRYAIAVHLKNMTCIQLTLRTGSAGGNPTYCFDKDLGNLVSRYDEVE